MFSIGAGGDKYMSIIQMARVKQVPVMDEFKQNWDTPEEWSSKLQVQQLELLNDAYVKYKRAKGKLDFIDMIEKFISQGTSPKFDLLIIDEAQDLCALWQWRIHEVLVPHPKEAYAGDDDQAIYGWMGVM